MAMAMLPALFSSPSIVASRIRCGATANSGGAISSSSSSDSADPMRGVSVYKPKSYEVLATDAANSLAFALQDSKSRLEIDFP